MPLEIQITKRLAEFTLNVSITAGDSPLGILGPSGAGKTMLLRCIAGLERPDRGRIVLDGRTLLDTEHGVDVPSRDRRVGMVIQHYALFPHKTIAENVAFGLHHLAPSERTQRVDELLERTRIAELGKRYPRQVSGGEQQRAALARALSIEPSALLLDEPLSALDTHLRSQLEAQLQEVFLVYRRPTLLVTHNVEEAYRLGRELLVLSRGQIAASGPREDVFRHPPSLEVARLTGCKNFSRAQPISEDTVQAIDWRCQLRVRTFRGGPVACAGIRAHHIDFVESSDGSSSSENVFPCWLVRSSESPFRVTLFLRLHQPPDESGNFDLQAEVYKEKWEHFRGRPLPWHVRLAPELLFVMPE